MSSSVPLGDSITEITCWRTTVRANIASAGVTSRIDFVGSMSNNRQNSQGISGWDQNHEGPSGYQAVDIANNNLAGWLANTKPDIVVFMLGTNDIVSGGKTATEILTAHTKMVGLMRSSNPSVRIIVDTVIPIGFGSYPSLAALNNAIPNWASALTKLSSPIIIVDCYTGYPTSALRDRVHPNAAGDAIIASRISPVLPNQIQSALAGTTPAPTTILTTTSPAPTTTSTRGNSGVGSPAWGQCDGQEWTGPTTCTAGTCKFSNAWYGQCIP